LIERAHNGSDYYLRIESDFEFTQSPINGRVTHSHRQVEWLFHFTADLWTTADRHANNVDKD